MNILPLLTAILIAADSGIEVPPIPPGGALHVIARDHSAAPRSLGARFSAKVLKVIDGDSLVVEYQGQSLEIRLAEIDTPEYDQRFGSEAKAYTRLHALDRVVSVEVRAIDAYKRRVSLITLPDGSSLNRSLLRAGLAWWYRYYSDDESLGRLEREAREARRGLWIDPDPVPPWIHRRNRRGRGQAPLDPVEL